jgi:hypothetical protein
MFLFTDITSIIDKFPLVLISLFSSINRYPYFLNDNDVWVKELNEVDELGLILLEGYFCYAI